MSELFKDMLKRWRKERGLPQKQAADIFGVTVRGYQKWEAGRCVPSELALSEVIRRMEAPKSE
jgi:transcriptional regulator with XRE-family HTH domain